MISLQEKAKKLRRNTLEICRETNDAHLGSSFSEIEILISLYDSVLKENDKFILSKGHAPYPLYLLLRERGYDPKITSHPDIDEKNGIYCTTGSLGHGLPIATGMALARKIQNKQGRIYVLMGDCECYEGTLWESSNITRHFKLDNLVLIVDNNKFGALDSIENILGFGDLEKTFEAFGYDVSRINGHNFQEIIPALKKNSYEKPRVIIADTIKGKGVSFMQHPKWHARMPTEEEFKIAYDELK